MGKQSKSAVVLLLILFLVWIPEIGAQWLENGILLCTAVDDQFDPQPVPDGSGGAIVAFVDSRNGNQDIYAQRIDADGNILWTADGIAVCTAAQTQEVPQLIPDGEGGAIITWDDYRGGSYDIFAQRVNPEGNVLWATDGVPICQVGNYQILPNIISDGDGGAIITWQDGRSGLSYDIYAQRIDPDGNVLWTTNGIAVCTASQHQEFPQITTDSDGGAIITWQDNRSLTPDVYSQRVSADGNLIWTANGVAVCSAANSQQYPVIISDNVGGAIITWYDYRSADWDIYAQKLNSLGSAQWAADGIAICTASNAQRHPRLISDGAMGAIIVWEDYRSTNWDIYVQRIDLGGNILWTANGVVISASVNSQSYPRIVSDDDGGGIVAWWDFRGGSNTDVYVQKIDADGNALWTEDGVALCMTIPEQQNIRLTSDDAGGAIIVWQDVDALDYSVHAQRIERNGYWGYPAPRISAVRDIPGDQGGYVNLAWDASRLDPWPDELITQYSIWRAISPTSAALMAEGIVSVLGCVSEYDPEVTSPVMRKELLGSESFYWELVSSLTAYNLETYSQVMSTLFDSTSTSDEYHYFQVIAHTRESDAYWISGPDSGYSVDNLAPEAPLALAGKPQDFPEGLLLTWDPNVELDLDSYAVYRGLTEEFEPGPANIIASPCDTFAFDGVWRLDSYYFYKVSAIDIHGNESPFTMLHPKEITDDEMPEIPLACYLEQNAPNPFNPKTMIGFGLRESGHVNLRIYDAAGKLICVLVDGLREAAHHEVSWDGTDRAGRQVASGVYFYRLVTGEFTETRKMVLLR